jgi:transcriptional regulator with XRE-family HTH domain
MSMRVLRKRSRTKITNRQTPALSLTLRPTTPLGSGVHARYSLVVAHDGSVDRDAWAQLVGELLQRETKGKKLPFARKIGVDPRTVDRWLRREVVVSEESVRSIARAFDLQAIDLLVQVGYYKATDVAPPPAPDPYEDPIIRKIMADPRWTEEERADLVKAQIARMKADFRRRQADYEQLVRMRQGHRDAS